MKRISIEKIEFKKMGFYYVENEKVFENVDALFLPDDVNYLQGPRGSGKNSLIKLLLGLQSPTAGDFCLNGQRVNDLSYKEFDPYRLNMGHSFDAGGLINNLSLFENFMLILNYHDVQSNNQRPEMIIDLLKVFDLQDQKHLRPAFLSGSARKAASVLRAFLLRPEVLILNDPTQGLSVEHIDPLVDLINQYKKEHQLKFVFISSDDQKLIEKLPGKILDVTTRGLFEKTSLRRVS